MANPTFEQKIEDLEKFMATRTDIHEIKEIKWKIAMYRWRIEHREEDIKKLENWLLDRISWRDSRTKWPSVQSEDDYE